MNDNLPPNIVIARAIERERAVAHLSLSALAARAGLAKSTLSQLEAGKGNPNVETLWAIATALGIPFSSLFEGTSGGTSLVRAGEGASIASNEADFTAVLLDRSPADRRRDLYRIALTPGQARSADAHPRGTIEHAFVASGRVKLGPLTEEIELDQGDYFRFAGDVAHSYEALGGPALILLVMDALR